MSKYLFLISWICFFFELQAQEKEHVAWKLKLDQVDITAQRKFQDIGVAKTKIDTVILRESVVNSIADILSQNTSIFIKNYGRGTLATASFRGTAPSHTQVLWNGMKINSPMLGQVDFSLIPSYFVDDMTLWHGASSVNVSGGGLGGAITLNTKPMEWKGTELNFIQGISSFNTYDEYLNLRYATEKWQSSTRVCYVNSRNDFKYRNISKVNIDDDGSVKDEMLTERNKNGAYRDFHFLQEFYYDLGDGNKFSLAAWLMDSKRGIPMLFTNQREENEAFNEQKETTLRLVGNWEYYRDKLKFDGKAGYNYDRILYTYDGLIGPDDRANIISTRSIVHSVFLQGEAQYVLSERLMFNAILSGNYYQVSSLDQKVAEGYDEGRTELSGLISARYRPHKRIGIAADIREEYYGQFTPVIPAAFIDIVLWPENGVILKGSVARNFRYPTLNDLYFIPGGNDSLRCEKGITYDGGIEFLLKSGDVFSFKGEITGYSSRIDDWILWLPALHGYWTPMNVKKVHSYGWELKGNVGLKFKDWMLWVNALWAQTRSINQGDPLGWTDKAIGRQLVYIPEYSSSVMGKLSWKGFTLVYKYNYFSERYTTSSNETKTKIGRLTPYYMNDISFEKQMTVGKTGLSLKLTVNNLFNEEYVSVLGHPMARRNYGFFIGIHPRW